jgi:hypothetical protein
MMTKPLKILLLTFLLLSLAFAAPTSVKAQSIPIEAEILPSQGGANTTILLRFTSTNSSFGNVQTADIFWDNSTIALSEQGIQGANLAYNYNLTVPNEPPLSDVGDHAIRVDSTIAGYGPVSFNFTFTVTEFVPSPEYIALNDTYTSLLTNYTNILGTYTQLLFDFTQLSANYTTLLAEYNNYTLNFNTLVSQYNVLNSNYNSLSSAYNLLSTASSNLTTLYGNLQADYQTLNASYSNLAQNYRDLNSGELAFSRNLNYTLIILTISLAIATIYLIFLKPKHNQKTLRAR